MNTFVALGDIDMFSKQKMLKINQTCHQEDFQVRAGSCERYILHRIYKIGLTLARAHLEIIQGFILNIVRFENMSVSLKATNAFITIFFKIL